MTDIPVTFVPVETVVFVRCQIFLQFIAGLLYPLAEMFHLVE